MTKMTKTLTAIAAAATLASRPWPPRNRPKRAAALSPPASSAGWPPAPSSARPPPTAPITVTAPAITTAPARSITRGGPCYWTHQRVWDGWGWRLQRVRVCD